MAADLHQSDLVTASPWGIPDGGPPAARATAPTPPVSPPCVMPGAARTSR